MLRKIKTIFAAYKQNYILIKDYMSLSKDCVSVGEDLCMKEALYLKPDGRFYKRDIKPVRIKKAFAYLPFRFMGKGSFQQYRYMFVEEWIPVDMDRPENITCIKKVYPISPSFPIDCATMVLQRCDHFKTSSLGNNCMGVIDGEKACGQSDCPMNEKNRRFFELKEKRKQAINQILELRR